MFNRAKFHKYRTKDMEAAMKVFSKWMKSKKIRHSFTKRNTLNTNNKKFNKTKTKKVSTCSYSGKIEPPCKYGSQKTKMITKLSKLR